jgi:hypothetical protein
MPDFDPFSPAIGPTDAAVKAAARDLLKKPLKPLGKVTDAQRRDFAVAHAEGQHEAFRREFCPVCEDAPPVPEPVKPAADAICTEEWCDTSACEPYPWGGFVRDDSSGYQEAGMKECTCSHHDPRIA